MSRAAVEVPAQAPTVLDWQNQQSRQDFFTHAITRRKRATPIAAGVLGPVEYVGGTLPRDAQIDGVGWPRIVGQVTFQSTGIVRGVVFEKAVVLSASANVQFDGCVFLEPITVASGGRIGCVGCQFNGTSAITNAGAPNDANRVGCTGTSALAADANVTVVGGI